MLYEVSDVENGLRAAIHNHVKGYSVTLQDTDCGEFVPTIKIFPYWEDALAYARKITNA